ncbi:MAG: LPP20 family lipoprotein [Proteobacteria bacterium]|nr:LPP20 family lipoprotein [Pseudomonadota bacterium]
MKIKLIFLIGITLFLLFPPTLLAGKIVTAKGISFFEPGRELIARDKAIDEAKRAALEQAIGSTVESQTTVENFTVIKDQILSRTAGYLKNIKVIEEKKTGMGTYEVLIEADVETSAMIEDLDRFKKVLSWQKNPRISILIDQDTDKSYLPAAHKSAALLTDKLKQGGFTVYKHSKGQESRMGLLVSLSLELSSKQSSYQNIDLSVNEISLSANIYRPDDGEILGTATAVKSLPGENKLKVLDDGAKHCIDSIWADLRSKLVKVWEKELYSERDINMVIKKIPSHARALEISNIFKSDVSGMLDSNLVNFKNGTAEFNVKYKGWPEHLLNEIQMSYFKKKYFNPAVESVEGNKIIISIN